MDFDKLKQILNEGTRKELDAFCEENSLYLKDGKIYSKDKDEVSYQVEFWDKRQLVKKINLNSLYGAILNKGCKFNDDRIGQSTTLTGRCIARHMHSTINETLTGEYNHEGAAIIYGDTDSSMFSAWPMIKEDVEQKRQEWNKEICIQLYDSIADAVNESFPIFMEQAFHVPYDNGRIIKCGREIVATKGLFIKKKRYAMLMIDKDKKRLDKDGKTGKVKAMGLDLKRSDTPKVVQVFLSDLLERVLNGEQKEKVVELVLAFKREFKLRQPWEKGTPKRVNKLTHFSKLEKANGKANLPGHVRAALNWNTLLDALNDRRSIRITDGMKCIVCKLRDNPLGMTSIAYPIDEIRLPDWFKELPFDEHLMEDTIVTQKVENLLKVLGWELDVAANVKNNFDKFFKF